MNVWEQLIHFYQIDGTPATYYLNTTTIHIIVGGPTKGMYLTHFCTK